MMEGVPFGRAAAAPEVCAKRPSKSFVQEGATKQDVEKRQIEVLLNFKRPGHWFLIWWCTRKLTWSR